MSCKLASRKPICIHSQCPEHCLDNAQLELQQHGKFWRRLTCTLAVLVMLNVFAVYPDVCPDGMMD